MLFTWTAAGAVLIAANGAASAQAQDSAGALAFATPDTRADRADADRQRIAAWERGDRATAVESRPSHARSGNADAQFNLAQALRLGQGMPADPARAEALYRSAAANGHVAASGRYAIMLYGRGRQVEAMPLLLQAAEAGDARARYLVGLANFNGDLLPRDWPRAFALLSLAAQANLAPARNALGRVEEYLDPAQKEEGRALARFMASAAGDTRGTDGVAVKFVAVDESVHSSLVRPLARAHRQDAVVPAETARRAFLQLGAFGDPDNAVRLRDRLARDRRLDGYSVTTRRSGRLTMVTAHGAADAATAKAACRALQAAGFECLPRG